MEIAFPVEFTKRVAAQVAYQHPGAVLILGDQVLIRVTDNGPGMKDDILAAATKPFYTTKPAGKGTGLGLSICKQITGQHQGQLSLKNTGNGLCVEIELPKEQL